MAEAEDTGKKVLRRETERDRTKKRLDEKRLANRLKSMPGAFRKRPKGSG